MKGIKCPKENAKTLWWKHFRIWIIGVLISIPAASIFGIAFNDQNPSWVVPSAIAILFLPLVFVGVHAINHRYSMYVGVFGITRGKPAIALGIFCIGVYLAAVALSLLYTG